MGNHTEKDPFANIYETPQNEDPFSSIYENNPSEASPSNSPSIKIFDTLISDYEKSGDFQKVRRARFLGEIKLLVNDENRAAILAILVRLEQSKSPEQIEVNFEELRKVTQEYRKTVEQIHEDTVQENTILSDKFLDEIDFLGALRPSMRKKLEESENMDLGELIDLAKRIELSGEINGKESWNALFLDLRDKVNDVDLAEFDRQVQAFKTDEKDVYEANIDTSSLRNSLDQQLEAISSGALDEQFQNGGVKVNIDVESMLGGLAETLGLSEDLSNLLSVGPFTDKEIAVRTIYKLKLVFEELEKNGKDFLAYYYEYVNNTALYLGAKGAEHIGEGTIDIAPGGDSIIQTPFHYITGAILASLGAVVGVVGNALPTGVTLFFLGAPLESGWRRIKDKISVWIGDKGFAAPINAISRGIGTGSQWVGNQAIAGGKGIFSGSGIRAFSRLGNLIRFTGAGSAWIAVAKPAHLLLGGFGRLVTGAENIHLDASNLLSNNILLVDGLSGNIGDSALDNAQSNDAIEIRSRVKMLALWKRIFEYQGNTQALKKLDKIANGSLFANSESYYIDLDRLIRGEIGNSEWGARLKRFGIDITNIMLIPNKKERMVKLHLEYMKKTEGMLSEIYRDVRFINDRDNPRASHIELPENKEQHYTDFVKEMKGDIDYSLLTHAEEQAREKELLDFFKEIERGGAGILTPEEIRLEISKITEGYLPKYKILRKIKQHRATLTEGSDEVKHIEELRRIVLDGDWYGTQSDLSDAISDLSYGSPSSNTPPIRDIKDVREEGRRLRALSLREDNDFNRITDISSYSAELSVIGYLHEMGIGGHDEVTARRELVFLMNSARNTTTNVDFTIPEFNHAISKILGGEKFSDMGDGTFGNAFMFIDDMLKNYGNFDTQVSDMLKTSLISTLKTQDQETRIKIIQQLESDTSMEELRRENSYKGIIKTLEGELETDISDIEKQLKDLRDRRTSLSNTIQFDQNSGESENLKSLSREIQDQISTLETQLKKAKANGAKITSKIIIIQQFPNEIIDISSKLDTFEVDIENYNLSRPSNPDPTEENPKPTETQTPKSETVTKTGKLTAAAKRVVQSAEYILRANEFSHIDALARLTPEIEGQLQDLRDTGILPDGTNVKDMSLAELRLALKTQLGLTGSIPAKVADAEKIFTEAIKPDRDARVRIETRLGIALVDGEPRSWDEMLNDKRTIEGLLYEDGVTEDIKASLRILANPKSPAEAMRQAKTDLKQLFRNMR